MDPKWREAFDRVWPKTKVELEKVAKTTKVLIDKGEAQVKEVSARSAREIKKLSLALNKERLYLKLGKLVSKTTRSEWAENTAISSLIKEVKAIEQSLRKIDKEKGSHGQGGT